MKKIKIILPLIIVTAVSVVIYYTFYKDSSLLGGLSIKFDKEQIKEKAALLVQDLSVPVKGLKVEAKLKANKELLRQVQQEYGFKKGNELIRKSLPGYYWEINWMNEDNSSFTINSGSDTKIKYDGENISVQYDNSGNLLFFNRGIKDSTKLPSLSQNRARDLVRNFISKFGTIQNLSQSTLDTAKPAEYSFISGTNELYNFKIERRIELPHRVDYQYTWSGKSSYIDDNIKMEVTVSGNVISNFKVTYDIPAKYTADNSNIYLSSIVILFYLIIIIMVTVLAYRKVKAYEIGFRTAFIMAVIVIISSGLQVYTEVIDASLTAKIFSLVLGPLFLGAALFITWAVSETVTRETWKEKLLPVDLLTKGYFTHSKIGEAVFRGLTFGLGLSAAWFILLYVVQNFTGVWSASYNTLLLSHLNSSSPSLSILDKFIYTSIFLVAVYFNLITSGLKRRFKSTATLIITVGVIWGLVNSNDIHPVLIGICLEIIIGLVLTWTYIKYDGLTTLLALTAFYTSSKGFALFTLGHPVYTQSGYFLVGIFLLLVIFAFYALFGKDKHIDFNAIAPAFVANITERQRLQRELEIAREVQMSFLPRKNPQFKGLEIASSCIPALEVGGDYYDFVLHDEHKLGVIIGDVSGKGTQAAFYMTLTKGFLKAVSRSFSSPAQFLREMNSLFYDNVERGTFISMVYGIFDIENKKFTLARAGHNPVIVRNSSPESVETLNPTGLALGLEKGAVFNNTIKEVEIPIARNDVFVFYTDGFTEAMNKTKDEFGEERLIKLVEQNSALSAEEILDAIIKEAKIFMGRTPQHDDMTMVVVKINY